MIFPPQPNLYYWAFGEDTYSRPSAMAGWSLPHEGSKYFSDDGLGAGKPTGSS